MNRRLGLVLAVAFAAATVRQVMVFRAISRSRRFLMNASSQEPELESLVAPPAFYVVIPMLREATGIAPTIDHFDAVMCGHEATLVIVTTERERAEHDQHPSAADTATAARRFAEEGRCIHLHYSDVHGLKADQLNYAAEQVASLVGPAQVVRTYLLCYDADSRPPLDTLTCFEKTIAQHPEASVLHQSSRFELRPESTTSSAKWPQRVRDAVADAGALRANRFVLAYELPRLLNRSSPVPDWKRRLFSYVYTHVTGHGLCIQLAFALRVPFPARSPLEDMHYSFILNSWNVAMQPVPSLDVAEVSPSPLDQLEQSSRWFYGPGRFLTYVHDPQTASGARALVLSGSAAAICVEWLSCAILPAALLVLPWRAPPALRAAMSAFVFAYAGQLVTTDVLTAPASPAPERLLRILAYPTSCTLFGVGGFVGVSRLLRGVSTLGKTERLSA